MGARPVGDRVAFAGLRQLVLLHPTGVSALRHQQSGRLRRSSCLLMPWWECQMLFGQVSACSSWSGDQMVGQTAIDQEINISKIAWYIKKFSSLKKFSCKSLNPFTAELAELVHKQCYDMKILNEAGWARIRMFKKRKVVCKGDRLQDTSRIHFGIKSQ